jgi:hypothetical protein
VEDGFVKVYPDAAIFIVLAVMGVPDVPVTVTVLVLGFAAVVLKYAMSDEVLV